MSIDANTINKIAETIVESSPIADQLNVLDKSAPKKVIAHALSLALYRFTHEYPALGAVINSGVGANLIALELSKILADQEKPNPKHIAKIWEELLETKDKIGFSEKENSDLENVATIFIEYIRDELAKEQLIETESSAIAYFNRGQLLLSIKNYEAALADFDLALSLDPNFSSAKNYRNIIQEKLAEINEKSAKQSTDLVTREYLSMVNSVQRMNVSTEMKNNLLADLYSSYFGVVQPADNLKSIIAFNQNLSKSLKNSIFTLVDSSEPEIPELTPQYLARIIHPYIQGIVELQQLIDQINKRPLSKVVIKSIQQNSPVSVSLDGASDAIQLIKETVVPWRRKHAETMAHLLEQEKLAEIELKKAEVLEKRAIAAKERELTDKLKVENEKLRAETSLQQAKIQLATELVTVITTNLGETEKERYIAKLLPVLDILALGRLEMVVEK